MLLGIRGSVDVDIGAYVRPNGMTPVRNAAQFLSGPYRVPNIQLEARAYVSNKTPSGTYRGPGRFEGCFFTERMLEMAARALKLDPIEIRRRNLVALNEMPYPLANVVPNDGFGVTQCDSGDYSSTFAHCLDEAGWSEKLALQGKLIDGRYHGLGLACFIEGGGSGPRENARIAVDDVGHRRLCRLVRDRAGDRDDLRADRRRRARAADGAYPRAARLDDTICAKASAPTVRARP